MLVSNPKFLPVNPDKICLTITILTDDRGDMMRDRNPAIPSVECPKCGKKSFRQGFFTKFIKHWLCYCEDCGYKTEPSVSENDGLKEWLEQFRKEG